MSDQYSASTIKALRGAKAWSQEQLAEIAGLSPRTVQRLEQGQRPSLDSLKALAAAFGVPLSQLQGSSERPPEDMKGTPMTALPADDYGHRRRRFFRHLAIYAAVMIGLTVVNLTKRPDHLWFLYPLAGWGLALAVQAFRTLSPRRRG